MKRIYLCLLLAVCFCLMGCNAAEFKYEGDKLTYGKGAYKMAYAKTGVIDEYYVVAGGINPISNAKDKFAETVLDVLPLENAKSLRSKYPAMFKLGADTAGKQAIKNRFIYLGLFYDTKTQAEIKQSLETIADIYTNNGERPCIRIKGDVLEFESGTFNKYDSPEPKINSNRLCFIYVTEIEIIGNDW